MHLLRQILPSAAEMRGTHREGSILKSAVGRVGKFGINLDSTKA